jgi:DNA repair exonuclease SbcCD ATPase subunit
MGITLEQLREELRGELAPIKADIRDIKAELAPIKDRLTSLETKVSVLPFIVKQQESVLTELRALRGTIYDHILTIGGVSAMHKDISAMMVKQIVMEADIARLNELTKAP